MSKLSQPASAAVPRTARMTATKGTIGPGKTRAAVPHCGQRGRVDALANFDAQELEVFAQVELRAQLADGFVPLGDRLSARGTEQPRGELILSRASPGGTQPLEQRADAEEVEIRGIGVIVVEVGEPGRARALPPSVEPRRPFE